MIDELNYIADGLRALAVPLDELHIDPAYLAASLERWHVMTGQQPVLEIP